MTRPTSSPRCCALQLAGHLRGCALSRLCPRLPGGPVLGIRRRIECAMVIPMVIQTILLDPSGAAWTDGPPNVSRQDPSRVVQFDAEHLARNRRVEVVRLPSPDRAQRALRSGSTVNLCHAAPAGPRPPAWRVGRSPATRPRAVTPGDPPEDAPARGDHHRARIGDRQGLQVHLLAQTRRRPSVHPADVRLALPGVPRPRPAVLQPRRHAVPGPRHRADGGGASPTVAGQGDDEGRHSPARSVP